MLLTVSWGLGVILGARDYDPALGGAAATARGKPIYTQFRWTNCVSVTEDIPATATIMMASTVLYLIVQLPAFAVSEEQEQTVALVGAIIAALGFCLYIYQQLNSAAASERIRRNAQVAHMQEWQRTLARNRLLGERHHQNLIFRAYDRNKDGYIDAAELQSALLALGLKVARRDIGPLLASIDTGDDRTVADGDPSDKNAPRPAGFQDGRISKAEFKRAINAWLAAGQKSDNLVEMKTMRLRDEILARVKSEPLLEDERPQTSAAASHRRRLSPHHHDHSNPQLMKVAVVHTINDQSNTVVVLPPHDLKKAVSMSIEVANSTAAREQAKQLRRVEEERPLTREELLPPNDQPPIDEQTREERVINRTLDTLREVERNGPMLKAVNDDIDPGDSDEDDDDKNDEDDEDQWALSDFQLKLKAVAILIFATAAVAIFTDPMIDVITALSAKLGINAFYVSFVVTPIVSNASEVIAGLLFALKKSTEGISLTVATFHGAATMNSTLGLFIFLILVYARHLNWQFSAEVITVVTVMLLVGINGFRSKTIFVWQGAMIITLYPLAIVMIYILKSVAGLS